MLTRCKGLDVFWLSVCIWWSSCFTVDTDTEISCSWSVILPLFNYGDPLITAAEESDDSHCVTNNSTNNINNTDLDYFDSGKNTTSCTEEDAHVAQGVAFFLQNFFILLRLVMTLLYTCTNSKPQLYYIFYTVLLYSSLEEQKQIQIAFEQKTTYN